MAFRDTVRGWFRGDRADVTEAQAPQAAPVPQRAGFEFGIGPGGLTEYSQGIGQSTQTDRRSMLTQLYESYLACPWSNASVNAVARTVTAGGLVTDWDTDTGEGQDSPGKPGNVLALERLLGFCNPRQDIRQLMRNVITDLLVFGDAFLEVTWVGNIPVALYNLDAPTMFPVTDDHGTVTKFVQVTDFSQRAEFDPRDVIHISLDAPRSGVFGVSPTQMAMLPVTAWLFAAATGKEMFRKGLPPEIHVDFPGSASPSDVSRWLQQYAVRNIGPRNLGVPITTRNGAHVVELASGRIADVESFLSQKRDEIIAVYGVPPSKVGIIESGSLGGGTGEAQHRTFMLNTCQPLAELILEKINFHIVRQGFGVEGWHLKFADIDLRDSKTVEDIRDMRLRNGSWTLNKLRADIGEPPVDGGDDAVLVDRQNIVVWRDMDAMSKAMVAGKAKGTDLEPADAGTGEAITLHKVEPAPVPDVLKPFAGQNNLPAEPAVPPVGAADAGTDPKQGNPPAESWAERNAAYRQRLAEALKLLPGVNEAA